MVLPEDVQLTDLQVIQRYSIAVRGASASREEVIATLTADLEWLGGGRRRTAPPAFATKAPAPPEAPAKAPPAKAPARKAVKAPAKKATKSGARNA